MTFVTFSAIDEQGRGDVRRRHLGEEKTAEGTETTTPKKVLSNMLFSCFRKPQPSPTRESARPASTEASEASQVDSRRAILDSLLQAHKKSKKDWQVTLSRVLDILERNELIIPAKINRPECPASVLKEMVEAVQKFPEVVDPTELSIPPRQQFLEVSHTMVIVDDLKDNDLQKILFKEVFLGEGRRIGEAICPYCSKPSHRPVRNLLAHFAHRHEHLWLRDYEHAFNAGYALIYIPLDIPIVRFTNLTEGSLAIAIAPNCFLEPSYAIVQPPINENAVYSSIPDVSPIMRMIWSLRDPALQSTLFARIFLGRGHQRETPKLCPYCPPIRPANLHAHYTQRHAEKWRNDFELAVNIGCTSYKDIAVFSNS
ncbi:hypothetical protein PRIPAC_97993 [Pristionchus pacificus]|uniref:Uncharacterized protein n=1 Tax=Pristionchus pacificus TaxID=54126 RepID=A0A2A6CHA8_PRIPA|nr:hypothetical protein PRIPAC_97993 [Pristionchus pacificus]|eukprot:PDM77458.1 hypothetical protein PRIPAC_33188 [Pristionchus pacificus]